MPPSLSLPICLLQGRWRMLDADPDESPRDSLPSFLAYHEHYFQF